MKGKNVDMGYVYCLYDEVNEVCRIGMSNVSNYSRVNNQLSYYPHKLKTYKVHVQDPINAETYLHRLFKCLKTNGSWYKIQPETFLKYMNEYKGLNFLSVKGWLNDEVARGVKIWVLTINSIDYEINFVEYFNGIKKGIFTKDNKTFYIHFKDKNDYYSIKSGNAQEVTIKNKSKTQKLKGILRFKYKPDCDPLIRQYIDEYKSVDKREKFLEELNNK